MPRHLPSWSLLGVATAYMALALYSHGLTGKHYAGAQLTAVQS
jgi:hypothetical protein